jgi:stress response protein YsnF
MNQQSIVALFQTRESAEGAKRDLEAAGVPSSDISIRAADGTASTTRTGTRQPHEGGFLEWLFGTDQYDVPEKHQRYWYAEVEERGRVLLTVFAVDSEAEYYRISDILDRHHPINVDEGEDAASFSSYEPRWSGEQTASSEGVGSTQRIGSTQDVGETHIPVMKEELQVGKRQVRNAKAYRIRTTVQEVPVEEQVRLRDETVVVDRQPVSGRTATGDAFQERTVEVQEMHEEPVVAKTVRQVEDVVVRKDAKERVETVRDNVRQTKVEIDRDAAGNKPSAGAPLTTGQTADDTLGGAKKPL